MNFSPEIPDYTAPAAVASGWEWDITDWDDLEWGPENASTFDWLSIRGHGVAGALVLCVSGETAIEYNGGLVAYEAGWRLLVQLWMGTEQRIEAFMAERLGVEPRPGFQWFGVLDDDGTEIGGATYHRLQQIRT
jgi:hypothetical protein